MVATPIEQKNVLLEGSTLLTSAEKAQFAYFGEGAKIIPPYRILNPGRIHIGDKTAIREFCHINAFADLSHLMDYIDEQFRGDFRAEQYQFDAEIFLDREIQIGRFAFMSCTKSIRLERNVLLSERVFIGDNNHSYAHPDVPIMQQPNRQGDPVSIGAGSWLGVGVSILAGTRLGPNCVVGANSVVRGGVHPARTVLACDGARIAKQYRGQ
jgi:acetyltransferase-like isoleucine patch superfamily enzyme